MSRCRLAASSRFCHPKGGFLKEFLLRHPHDLSPLLHSLCDFTRSTTMAFIQFRRPYIYFADLHSVIHIYLLCRPIFYNSSSTSPWSRATGTCNSYLRRRDQGHSSAAPHCCYPLATTSTAFSGTIALAFCNCD